MPNAASRGFEMQKTIGASRDELQQSMAGKLDSELHEMLYVNSDDYTAEALEVAREEFQKRNLDPPSVQVLELASEKRRCAKEARLSLSMRLVAFVTSAIFFGIPAASFYFYYVRRGEKRKAADWATWGWSGFASFLAVRLIACAVSTSIPPK
jgi:hypothetical protein